MFQIDRKAAFMVLLFRALSGQWFGKDLGSYLQIRQRGMNHTQVGDKEV
jgi:hypothetical protein